MRFSCTVLHFKGEYTTIFHQEKREWGQEEERGILKGEREGRPTARNPYTGPGRTVTIACFQKRCKGTVIDAFKEMFHSKGK